MPEGSARVEVEDVDGVRVARILGEVDVSNVEEVRSRLFDATTDRARAYVVDLSETQYFDSAGIGLLFTLAARLKARRQELHIVVPEKALVRRVLVLTDLAGVVPIHNSLADIG